MVKSSGYNLEKAILERAVWFDIEKREADLDPAVTGILVDGEFSITVHDKKLAVAANYSKLKVIEGRTFFRDLIDRCNDENRKLISYTSADFGFITAAFPELEESLQQVYIKASFSSWFKRKKAKLYDELQANAKKKFGRSKNKFNKGPKKSGEFQIGLKDMLKLPAVGYPDGVKTGVGGSAKAIKKIRYRFEKTGADVEKITTGEKKAWSKMLTYLKHDVVGLCHLTKWVNDNN